MLGIQDSHLRILSKVEAWLNNDLSVWLCTVISTYGSSPRPAGSLMAINERAEVIGSLSGGCIEEQLIQQVTEKQLVDQANGQKAIVIRYGITKEDQERLKLPCGGQLRVLIEMFEPGSPSSEQVNQLIQALNNKEQRVRRIELEPYVVALETEVNLSTPQIADNEIRYPIGPTHQLLIIGVGEITFHLSQLAAAAGFRVTVCDPRENFREGWDNPGVELLCEYPDDVIRQRFNDEFSAVVAVSHDPRVDDMALMEALTTRAFYIGAMGSKKTTEKRVARLQELALSQSQISRLHAPIGLPIGSKTPIEIAVSIMAQLISERRQLAMNSSKAI